VNSFVLDSSALLALVKDEPGADFVLSVLPRSVLSTVNLAEVVAKLSDLNLPLVPLDATLAEANVEIVAFTQSQARLSGELRSQTRKRGLSLGDRACLALALERGLTAVTADAAWVGATDAAVKLIRPLTP
jgi:PIN domain nuclease of toxin-antitoxin system